MNEAEVRRAMDGMLVKIGEQQADIKFLLDRAARAGMFEAGESCRESGVGCNSIVAIAYGSTTLEFQDFPMDFEDLQACQRMLDKLPPHRLTRDVHEAMFRATSFVNGVIKQQRRLIGAKV